ncbi:uncharacterized protein LOC115419514 [Sphaeramia orbicularis]|uniref:uncharacterized protein LOC115419514 n=1 Tax=Sphaeramia orbicularis TaxID=375764 RepID=UPI00117E08CA|nr:uncharacterized protein LOC115419514 [Sphaeramia orbicularis]
MSLDLTKMTRVIVELSLVLILTVHGVLGSEMTINAAVGTSATVHCKWDEELMRCSCPYPYQGCADCKNLRPITTPLERNTNTSESYLTFTELQPSTSGLYTCSPINNTNRATRTYRINVIKDRDPTVVIGTLGNATNLTCGSGVDLVAASEPKWCRSDTSAVCENTIMRSNEIRGDFKVHSTENSFILENRRLTHDAAGLYKCTLDFPDQNQTLDYVVNLTVIDSPTPLKIHEVQARPKGGQPFEITCPYPQKWKFDFSKSWRCDNADCPKTVKIFEKLRILNVYRHSVMIAHPTVVDFSYDRVQEKEVYPTLSST